MNLHIIEINAQSILYPQLLQFRNQWLRLPLGLNLFDEDLNDDLSDIVLLVMCEEEILGCIMLHPLNQKEVKFRQMAIHSKFQGKGIGKALIEDAEQLAKEKGFEKVILHARKSAIGFYEKNGYLGFGETFLEVTIPHLAMEKILI